MFSPLVTWFRDATIMPWSCQWLLSPWAPILTSNRYGPNRRTCKRDTTLGLVTRFGIVGTSSTLTIRCAIHCRQETVRFTLKTQSALVFLIFHAKCPRADIIISVTKRVRVLSSKNALLFSLASGVSKGAFTNCKANPCIQGFQLRIPR